MSDPEFTEIEALRALYLTEKARADDAESTSARYQEHLQNARATIETQNELLSRARIVLCAAPPVYATNGAVMQLVLDIQRR